MVITFRYLASCKLSGYERGGNIDSTVSKSAYCCFIASLSNRKTPTSTSGSGTPGSASVGVESPTEDSMFNFS